MKKIDYEKWHSGAPPGCGWWPASGGEIVGIYRWWNGQHWSNFAIEKYSAKIAAKFAKIREPDNAHVKWQHRPDSWPARSKN